MKLLELLVQELPKIGGWPHGVCALVQSSQGSIYRAGGGFPVLSSKIAEDWDLAEVTREQYEAAVKKPVWDGMGLPPVGCECELSNAVEFYTHSGSTDFEEGSVVVVGGVVNFGLGDFVAVKVKGSNCITDINPCFLRPIRSEAEHKRSDICDKIYGAILRVERKDNKSDMAESIYDAIAAGDIPGLKVED